MNRQQNLITIILTMISFLLIHSIAYSAIASTITIKGEAFARVNANIRITDFKLNKTTSSAVSSYEEFNKDVLDTNIMLPNVDSSITYKIDVTNYGISKMGVYSITGLPENLTYELTDYTLKEKICDESSKCTLGATKTFYMTIKYKNYTGITNYNINLTFNYKVVYDVTYQNMTNNSFPAQVGEGESLNINIVEKLYLPHITIGTQKLNYSEYTYSNGNLIVNNITDDVVVNLTKIIKLYDYTGTYQTFTAPETGVYRIELWGAGSAGKGGYTSGDIALTKGTNLYVYVGEYGSNTEYVFNGGGGGRSAGSTGAGATDIRLISGEWDDFESLKSRIMVAAGGGGSSHGGNGGPAGGLIGYDGIPAIDTGYTGICAQGFGATQIKGGDAGPFNWSGDGPTSGTFGIGGKGNSNYGGGGGGGYYGGGGSGVSKSSMGGGAGGSSYISGHNGCIAITEESTIELITHKNNSIGEACIDGTTDITCSYHYSNYIFENTNIIDGSGYKWTTQAETSPKGIPTTFDGSSVEYGHAGNGYVKISLL